VTLDLFCSHHSSPYFHDMCLLLGTVTDSSKQVGLVSAGNGHQETEA